ncbi:hypothetical protein MMC07_005715 [Pseudocyphellaria aurata]|nr:hypothetical protein [Pseudocyphellaria aurata]
MPRRGHRTEYGGKSLKPRCGDSTAITIQNGHLDATNEKLHTPLLINLSALDSGKSTNDLSSLHAKIDNLTAIVKKQGNANVAPKVQQKESAILAQMEFTSPATLTLKQSAQIFEIQCKKLQIERDLAVRVSELELECMRNESQARTAAASTAVAATARVQATGPGMEDDEERMELKQSSGTSEA